MTDEQLLYVYTVMFKTIPEPNDINVHLDTLGTLYDELHKTGLREIADEITDLYSGRTFKRVRGDNDDKA